MFFVILGIVAWIIFAFWPASIAKRKGYSFILFFLLSIFISWILTLILVLILTDKNMTDEERRADEAAEKALAREEGLE